MKSDDVTADNIQATLKARAAKLAARMEAAAEKAALDVVGFSLGPESYAIESRFVREVCPLKQLTALPGVPAFVLGIIHVRGRIVSVIDIRKFFDLNETGLPDLDKVVVIQSDDMEIAILADKVTGYSRILTQDVQPPLPTWTGVRAEYLKGVTGNRLVILDAERLLHDERIVVRDHPES